MSSRKAVTLVEVLVAIFVMGIGMMALLTLFPLGVLRMAQAISDDRCATAAANGSAIATFKSIRHDSSVRSPTWFSTYDIFKDAPTGERLLAADPEGPSYPVFVDPIGVQTALVGSDAQHWLGIGGNVNTKGYIARCPTSFGFGTTNAYKWFALLDDLNFDTQETGSSGGLPRSPLQREIRYSWSYLVQRPRSSDSSVATCSVVVFNKRPLSLTGGLALPEASYNATFNIATNVVTVNWGGASAPNVRAGDWILDATIETYTRLVNGVMTTYPRPHGYFYRIVGVTETGGTSVDLEVHQPIRGFPTGASTPNGVVMVLEGISEVYERGVDRKPN